MIGAALFILLAACWLVAVPNPAWGIPVGCVAFVVGGLLLARDEKESGDG